MNVSYPRAVACGDSGVCIEFGDVISQEINEQVLALDEGITADQTHGVIETVPAYASLLIHYDASATCYDRVSKRALALARKQSAIPPSRLLKVPVCYEGLFAPDISQVAADLGLSASEVIDLHLAQTYRVYMLGFQPGFAYLGGLDGRLCLPRRSQIRHGAPAGTISIAASQCAVHSIEGPSGWHWIGRTPAPTLIPGERPQFVFRAGDQIRFASISSRQWRDLQEASLEGTYFIEVESACQS